MACPIDFCAFTWEAFASLVTGIAAVSGAVWVGRKQVAIQEKQVELKTQSLKSELFAKRLENYESVRDFMNSVLRTPDVIDDQLLNRFFVAQREARFLFSPNVYQRLDEIWNLCAKLNALALQLNHEIKDNAHAGVDLPQQKLAASLAVNDRYVTLHETYAEMSLEPMMDSPPSP
jgi:Zn-dependent oligopeptidase